MQSYWIVSSITRSQTGDEIRARPVEWWAPTPEDGEPVPARPDQSEAFAVDVGSSMSLAIDEELAAKLQPGDNLIMLLERFAPPATPPRAAAIRDAATVLADEIGTAIEDAGSSS